MGRGAAFNGDGRAVYPPGVLTPMRRYRQPEPEPRSLGASLARVFLLLLVGIVMIAAGLAGGAYLFAHESVASTAPHSIDVKKAAKKLNVALPGQPAIALVVGYDHRLGKQKDFESRSDTIMLVRADPGTKSISMLSFPRDLLVTLKCAGKPDIPNERINGAYSECGAQGTLETVRALTGLPINYLVTVDFHGFKDIVNRLGDVWIDVDRRYYNKNVGTDATNYADINLLPGYQKLSGQQALDYVRYRHTDSDLYRLARQQQFVRSLKLQLNRFSPFKIPKLVGAVTKNTQIAQQGGGISLGTLKSYALLAYGLPAGHFFQAKLGGLIGYNTLTTDSTSIQNAVHDLVTPDIEAPEKATAAALGQKPRRQGLKPQSVSVLVLNGTTREGLARDTSYTLGLRGYKTVTPANGLKANAPSQDYFRTLVYYDTAQPHSKVAAQQVAKLVKTTEIAPIDTAIAPFANGAMTVVVLGQTFSSVLAAPPADATPKHVRPAVRTDPAASLASVRAAAAKLAFPLMLPHVLASNTRPDSNVPYRVYEPKHHFGALRLVYTDGISDYWGIQETNWLDAPALSQPNTIKRLHGRTYELYYSGSHLHMVVLTLNGVSYWVVNTLLDSLTNETMLAIAQGLRPYGAK